MLRNWWIIHGSRHIRNIMMMVDHDRSAGNVPQIVYSVGQLLIDIVGATGLLMDYVDSDDGIWVSIQSTILVISLSWLIVWVWLVSGLTISKSTATLHHHASWLILPDDTIHTQGSQSSGNLVNQSFMDGAGSLYLVFPSFIAAGMAHCLIRRDPGWWKASWPSFVLVNGLSFPCLFISLPSCIIPFLLDF